MEVVSQQGNRENLEQAFEIAESLGVTRLLDAEGEIVNLNKSSLISLNQFMMLCPGVNDRILTRLFTLLN